MANLLQYEAQTGMEVLESPVVWWFEAQNGMDEPEMPQAQKNEMMEHVQVVANL